MPFAAVAVIAVTAGRTLAASCPDMRSAELRAADRVLITSSMNDPLRTISDPSSISDLVAFAEAHESGWGAPRWGPSGGLLRANFYSRNRFLGDLGVGSDFLAAQGCADLQSRPLPAGDRAAVIRMFGVPDPYKDSVR